MSSSPRSPRRPRKSDPGLDPFSRHASPISDEARHSSPTSEQSPPRNNSQRGELSPSRQTTSQRSAGSSPSRQGSSPLTSSRPSLFFEERRRASEPAPNTSGLTLPPVHKLLPPVQNILGHHHDSVLTEQISSVLCADLRSMIHREMREVLKKQSDLPGKVVQAVRMEVQTLFKGWPGTHEEMDQHLEEIWSDGNSSHSSDDEAGGPQVEKRVNTMPELAQTSSMMSPKTAQTTHRFSDPHLAIQPRLSKSTSDEGHKRGKSNHARQGLAPPDPVSPTSPKSSVADSGDFDTESPTLSGQLASWSEKKKAKRSGSPTSTKRFHSAPLSGQIPPQPRHSEPVHAVHTGSTGSSSSGGDSIKKLWQTFPMHRLQAPSQVKSLKKKRKSGGVMASRTDTLWSLEDALSTALFTSSDLMQGPVTGVKEKKDVSRSGGSHAGWSMKSVVPSNLMTERRDMGEREHSSNSPTQSVRDRRPSNATESSNKSGCSSSQQSHSSDTYSFGVGIHDEDGEFIAEPSSPLEPVSEKPDSQPPTPSGNQLTRKKAPSMSTSLEDVRKLREKQLTLDLTYAGLRSDDPSSPTPGVQHFDSLDNSEDRDGEMAPRASMQSCTSSGTPFGAHLVSCLLRCCGVLPWNGRRGGLAFYPFCVVAVAVLAVVFSVQNIIEAAGDPYSQATAHLTTHNFTDLAWSIGAFAVLSCCRIFHKDIYESNALLLSYASKHGCWEHWAYLSSWEALSTFAVWLIVVLDRWRQFLMGSYEYEGSVRLRAGLQMTSFVFVISIILIWIHYIQHVARGLGHMVDTFVFHFMETQDFAEAIAEWNILQAVIRKVCRCIQSGFFILQTSAVATVLLSIGDIANTYQNSQALVFLPTVVLVFAITRVFFCAGAVTDKCARVPALVNSLDVGSGLDHDRLYVVEYISHSQAGFYMFEARVTSAVVLKVFYFSCIVILSIASRVITQNDF